MSDILGNIAGFVTKALPWIGAAATGNVPALVTLAADAVGKALGKPVEANEDAIHAAIAGATPEQLLELRKADDELKLKAQALGFQNEQEMRALDVREKEADAADRQSARAMQTSTRSWTVPVLSWVVVIIALGSQAYLLFGDKPAINDLILGQLIATLNAALLIVLNFHFGSSSQSHAQTRMIAQSMNGPPTKA